jgi:hypothetical protein
MRDFVNEFFANFYAYDSKINNTIRTLFTKPGKMAFDFINGKRNSYANPFRFYLSVSLVYFILNSFLLQWLDDSELKQSKIVNVELQQNEQDSIKSISLEEKIKKKEILKKEIKKYRSKSFIVRNYNKLDVLETYLTLEPDANTYSALSELGIPLTKWNSFLFKKSKKISEFDGDLNPENMKQFEEYLYSKLPFLLFLSIPFLTLCFSFVYIRSHYNYAEHLVFVFSNMAFLFILLLMNEFQMIFTKANFNGIIILGYIFYFYKSLRNFYQQKRWKTILKFVILSFLLSIASTFTLIFVVLFSFVFY